MEGGVCMSCMYPTCRCGGLPSVRAWSMDTDGRGREGRRLMRI